MKAQGLRLTAYGLRLEIAALAVVLSLCGPVSAAGQVPASSAGRWELEIDVGGVLANHPTAGTGALPAPGQTLPTISGGATRRVSSWYFGDGALLFNQVAEQIGRPERVTPIDAVVVAAAGRRRSGGAVGGRLIRTLGDRLSVEAAVHATFGTLDLGPNAVAGIEAARASFATAWTALLSPGIFAGLTVTSETDVQRGRRRDVLTTGAVNVALKTTGRAIPYLTGGAGVASAVGRPPRVTLVGSYAFRTGSAQSPFAEVDAVTLRISAPNHRLVGIVGGGLRYEWSSRWSVRAEARLHVGRSRMDTLLDAEPTIVTVTSPMTILGFTTTPSIQFRNFPSPGAGQGAAQSSLSGPPISSFTTFTGSGTQRQFSLTFGIVRRL
jgi:hypothetical protein